MTYPLSETFDDPQGRWNQVAPWDATEASDSVKSFLTTQIHVDLRSFREVGDLLAAPQNPDLDTVAQTVLDAETQTDMETDPGANNAEENWTLTNANNIVPNPSFETDTSGWSSVQGTEILTRITTDAAPGYGTASLQVTTDGSSEGPMSDLIAVSPSTSYEYSVWLKGTGNIYLQWHEYQADGLTSNGFNTGSTFALTNTWTQYTLTGTTAATTANLKLLVVYIDATPTTFWVDGVSLLTSDFGLSSLAVGPIAARGGWSGVQATATGAPITALFESFTADPIDISAMDELTVIFPDYNTPDGATSYVELTSSPSGTFSDSTYNSAQALFSANASVMPELRFAPTAFTTGAGINFKLSSVTGVRVYIADTTPPAAGTTFTMMGMRAVKTGWTESALDFDTRIGAICVPVTLDGNLYAGTVAENFQFVRGDGTKEDPIPLNLAMNMYFMPGGRTSPNDATGAIYNKVGFILREKKDSGAGTGSHIEAYLKFNDAGTFFETKRVSTTGGSPGVETDAGFNSVSVGGPLDGSKRYLLHVNVRGTQIDARIYETDTAHNLGALVWQLPTTITDANYVVENGRVGFIAGLVSRDAFIEGIDVAPTGFAELKTKRYNSRSPIDGAQLAAVFAPDINLWTGFTGPDILIDQTKTVSGNGSYRTALGITSNSFVVDDWTETYLQLALWVPSGVTLANQPQILLNTDSTTETLPMPKLQSSQWNDLYFDLGIFRNLITASGYSISIAPAANPDTPLGFFWVDDMLIGRRRVSWSVRATENGLFREFKQNINNPDGGVHFPANERGTELQVKAVALTEDAWVSSFKLFPRYAELGLPVYDQGFEKR